MVVVECCGVGISYHHVDNWVRCLLLDVVVLRFSGGDGMWLFEYMGDSMWCKCDLVVVVVVVMACGDVWV